MEKINKPTNKDVKYQELNNTEYQDSKEIYI
jgi:hypothetical protein